MRFQKPSAIGTERAIPAEHPQAEMLRVAGLLSRFWNNCPYITRYLGERPKPEQLPTPCLPSVRARQLCAALLYCGILTATRREGSGVDSATSELMTALTSGLGDTSHFRFPDGGAPPAVTSRDCKRGHSGVSVHLVLSSSRGEGNL